MREEYDTELGLEDESEDEQEMQDDAYEEFECDEDPTWSPEWLGEDSSEPKVQRCKIYCILTS